MPNPKTQLSNKQKVRLAALAAMPDSEIDTSDILEDTDWSKGQRGKFLIQGKPRFKVQKRSKSPYEIQCLRYPPSKPH